MVTKKPTKREPQHVLKLRRMGACREAVEFAKKFKTLQAAWNACRNPDWMQWLLEKTGKVVHRDTPSLCPGCALYRQVSERKTETGQSNWLRKQFPTAPRKQ